MIKPNNLYEEILREKVIDLALEQLNKEYIHGSHGSNSFDCAGLVWYIYKELLDIDIYKDGYGLSTTTKKLTSSYGKVTLYEENIKKNLSINKGDILFFHRQSKEDNIPKVDNKYPGHCGIYLKNNEFIHCPLSKRKVVINNLKRNKYWNRILVASKNIFMEDKTLKLR